MAESEQGHRIRVGLFDKRVEAVFDKALKDLMPLLRTISLPEGKAFRWSDYPHIKKALDKATAGLKSDLKQLIKKAIEQEYAKGLDNKISAQKAFYGATFSKMLEAQAEVLRQQRQKAVQSYMQRVQSGRFDISRRVWKIGEQAKADMATAIKAGLEDGLDYRELGRSIKQYLVEPNKLFRRVRGADGRLHLSQAAKNYHPGQGVYRSSVRNAQRVARTETNIAYRSAECDSVKNDPFVLGIRVNLSANHTTKLPDGRVVEFFDICDILSNKDYPSDFKFTGWHPHCRCFITYIQVPFDEAMEMIKKGLKVPPRSKPITDVPQAFKDWIANNRERLERSTSLPYFVRDNQKYITGVSYTPEGLAQIEAAQKFGTSMLGAKLGRTATKEARKIYEDLPAPKLTEDVQKNTEELAREFGIKVKPMTFLEANEGRANVNYKQGGAFRNNCQICVAVHEARLRGLDITALGYSDSQGSLSKILGENFETIWLNGGKAPQLVRVQGEGVNIFEKVVRQMSAVGRYHIGINNLDNTGHVITAERLKDGKLICYDPQSGDFVNLKDYRGIDYFELLKVDKLLFNKEMLLRLSEVMY